MKKTFLLLLLGVSLILPSTMPVSAQEQTNNSQSVMYKHPSKEQMRKQFEERLNLTDKQKEKAKAIHKQGREEIKPVMMQIELKRQEIQTVKLSRIAERAQKEKIEQLSAEIKELEKQAQDIRKKNSQEFESILNKKQKAELEKMKAEGRERFERYHKARPPFQGLGTPNFMTRPLLPPPGNDNNNLWK